MAGNEESSNKLKQAISCKISELVALTRAAGDDAVSDYLKQISESDNQLLSLHRALVKRLRRRSKPYTSISERQTWFSNFVSRKGERLSVDEAEALASLTKNWALVDIECLKACAEIWTTCPQLFCDGVAPDKDIIRRCYHDLERMEDLDATRRKVLLVTLSRQVYKRQSQLLSSPKARKRCRKTQSDHDSRHSTFLNSALVDICSQLWDDPKKDQDTRRKRLSRYSLFGWKWDRLTHSELILSLTHVAAKRFEFHKWTYIKIEALNAYTETLPQFAIRETLQKAWVAILNYYEGNTALHQAARPSPRETEEPQVNIDSAQSSDYRNSPSLGFDLAFMEDVFASDEPYLYLPKRPVEADRVGVTGDCFRPTMSIDDIIASCNPWFSLHGAGGSTNGPLLTSAGTQNIGSTYTNGHIEYQSALSESGTSTNPTNATLGLSIEATSEA
ncbi:uncharacterized protein BP01DRAFT_377375 [Aspergillus saccharolyticus JOP 1030-1]|uniref:Uncharacterized protein n=1 Tax=Aspergillus saccharolyticus JOP 1030-1 TaxID=1450539 RepID=A0A318Z126_9EURO|nr:hypothetical protein BP01DRAFT_377375 [Aspergillus saccharolyticus JOP 1030-1]PYH41001.1 hypothetical protein BP01DRAFT_377375 [Aspergillus saccharolyticus JOP 1030-1]